MRLTPQGPSKENEKLPKGSALAATARAAVRLACCSVGLLMNVLDVVVAVAVLPRLDEDDDDCIVACRRRELALAAARPRKIAAAVLIISNGSRFSCFFFF
jgi:hypothetical protein